MKKYLFVKSECLEKLLKCFSDQEEFLSFNTQLSHTIEEILFASQVARRNTENENVYTVMTLKQLFVLALFFQQNVELIHQMINSLEYSEIMEEDVEINNHLKIDLPEL